MARILLVEDEAITRRGLVELLTAEGYSVDAAASGEEALKLIGAKNFDAVITDYKQPGRANGIDVLKAFELHSPGRAKLLMTAYLPGHAGEQAIGAVYVPKPIHLEDLVCKLKTLLDGTVTASFRFGV